jgi:antitoxin component of MazEF toxin-antitoxin module
METRKIIKSGSSLAVVIPASVVKQLKIKKGDTVAWVNNGIVKIKEVVTNEKL